MKLPENLRKFTDTAKTRSLIFDRVKASFENKYPMRGKSVELRLKNLRYPKIPKFSVAEQKDAILRDRDLTIPLEGEFELRDVKTDQVLDKKKATVARVPYYTGRGTFISGGNEYSAVNQHRLKPGVYTRVRENGELESHFNLQSGTGLGFKLFMDPETGLMRMGIGQAKLKLYPVLKALGAKDDMLKAAWGDELLKVNQLKGNDPKAIDKLYAKAVGYRAIPNLGPSEKAAHVQEILAKARMDPEVTQATLGKPYSSVSPSTMLDASAKLIKVFRGEQEPDDRDSVAFRTIHGPEDFISEKVTKDAGKFGRRLLYKLDRDKSLEKLPSGYFTPQVMSVVKKDSRTLPLEEINPVDLLDQQSRIIALGEGGIGSAQEVPDEARNVHPSQFGFIDPVRGPECLPQDGCSQVLTSTGWKICEEVTQNDKLACNIDGRLEFHLPRRLVSEQYTGVLYGAKTKFVEYLVTPTHRMWVKPPHVLAEDGYRFEHAKSVNGERRLVKTNHLPYIGKKHVEHVYVGDLKLDPVLWAKLLGYYISEGNTSWSMLVSGERSYQGISITQVKEANADIFLNIENTLVALGLNFIISKNEQKFNVKEKDLGNYFAKFGLSHEKYLPEDIFEMQLEAREALLTALLEGDGRVDETRTHYCTSSARLARDVERLATSLGYSARIRIEPDNREERYYDMHIVCIYVRNDRLISRDAHPPSRKDRGFGPTRHHFTKKYNGLVWCATVPGSLLYVRRNGGIPFWTGNSEGIGIDVRAAYDTYKGDDKELYSRVLTRDNKEKFIPAKELVRSNVAFPVSWNKPGSKVKVMGKRGKIGYVSRSKVDYIMPDAAGMFSALSNMVPMISAVQGNRLLMGSKYATQALPLLRPETPLVMAKVPGRDQSFDQKYGRKIAAHLSKVDGKVVKVTPDYISVKGKDGKTIKHDVYNMFPFNRKTAITSRPVVKLGDKVKAKQVLAATNFAADDGTLALGKNLTVGYLPFKGYNFEDAIVVSESAAKKLTSQHLYMHEADKKRAVVNRSKFVSMFPTAFKVNQLKPIDKDGVIAPGTVVQPGDPLVLSMKPRSLSATDLALGKVHKSLARPYNDDAISWDHPHTGVVKHVVKTPSGVKVSVESLEQLDLADKVVNRYGAKGVIGQILPDDQMPVIKSTGKPLEVALTPLGIISRINPAQIHETLLGKVSEKTGKVYKLEGFNEGNMIDFVAKELKKARLNDTEDLIDPETGKIIPSVLVGRQHMFKLAKTAEAGFSARETEKYTADLLPAKGGKEGSKKIGLLDINALIGHGAVHNLREMSTIKGQRNDDFWRALRLGYPLPEPKVPFIYSKFVDTLKAAGINVKKAGMVERLLPMTDEEVTKMSSGAVQNPRLLTSRDLSPERGGLFDHLKTGGPMGEKWSHVELATPIVNPVMEEPVRRVLGVTKKELDERIANDIGSVRDTLASLDLNKEIARHKKNIATTKGAARDNSVKLLGYLTAWKKHDIKPESLIQTKIPVLPPRYRPISVVNGSTVVVSNVNKLYQDLITANDAYKELKQHLPDDELGEERKNIYKAAVAISGLGDPITIKNKAKGLTGLLKDIAGKGSPKLGMFQAKVMGKTQDLTGRAVVVPDPTLDMDQLGLPEEMAWKVYRPFVMKRLVSRGVSAVDADSEIDSKTPRARNELEAAMENRPVILNRAPTLHKFNIMALRPKLRSDKTIAAPSVIAAGFNLDHDGDAMQVHVPVTEDARREALDKLLPSKNLFDLKQKKAHYLPLQEAHLGLYLATKPSDNKVRRFKSEDEAIAAYKRGEIDINDPIEIK